MISEAIRLLSTERQRQKISMNQLAARSALVSILDQPFGAWPAQPNFGNDAAYDRGVER